LSPGWSVDDDVLLAKLAVSFPDRFVGYDHPTDKQEFFHIAVAQTEAEIQPDSVTANLG
jgi:hypothetical protein